MDFDLHHCKSCICLNYGQGKTCTLLLRVKKTVRGNQGSGQGKTFRVRTSNFDRNIYYCKSSHLQTQKKCILFGKLKCFSKCSKTVVPLVEPNFIDPPM